MFTATLTALLSLGALASTAPLLPRQATTTVTILLYTGPHFTGTFAPQSGIPLHTYYSFGTDIDNLAASIIPQDGYVVDLFDVFAEGACTGFLGSYGSPSNLEVADAASCAYVRLPEEACVGCAA